MLPHKKDKKVFPLSIKQDVCQSMTILLQNSKKAAIKMFEEGLLDRISLKAKESTEAYYLGLIKVQEKKESMDNIQVY